MAETIIVDIEMSSADVRKAEKEIMKAREQVEKLRAANKGLDKSSEAYTKNTVEIKKLNSEIRTNERVLIANQKAQEANEGSVEQLRLQLTKTSVEWSKLSKEERENTEEGKRLTAQKRDLTNQLKALEKQTGDNRRNVGNYSEGMKEALSSSDAFGGSLGNLFNLMKANPILLIVGLLVKFIDQVSKAQFIVDAFNSVVEPLNTMFQRMIGLVQELIDGGFSKIAKILRDPIGALTSFGEEMSKAAEQGRRLAEVTIEIEEAQNALILTEGKLKREIEEQRFAVEDLSKSAAERQEAAEKGIQAVKDLEAARLEVLNKEIEAAEIRAAQNDTDRKAQAELNKLLAQRDELAAESVARQKEIRNQLNTINKQQQDEARRQYETDLKNYEEAEKQKTEFLKAQAEERQRIIEEEIQRNNDAYILGLKEQLIARQITREEFDQALRDRELELLQWQRSIMVQSGQDTIEIDNQIADIKIANLKKVAGIAQDQSEVQQGLQNDELDTAFKVGSEGVKITRQFAGENVAVSKAAALVQTGINIAQSITKALADSGPILGPILGAISTAIGAVQQARIRSAPSSFADGVIGLQGPGTETSDSIPANLSRGESVMTARATRAYAPMLAAMEQSVGNTPNYQMGNRRFANGVIAAGNLPSVNTARNTVSEARMLANELRNMRIYLSLTELEDKQDDFDTAKNFADVND